MVATVLTVYGIETLLGMEGGETPSPNCCNSTYRLRYWNWTNRGRRSATVLRCNSTYRLRYWNNSIFANNFVTYRLQQYLPFTVLKLYYISLPLVNTPDELQQYLPFTVLKPNWAVLDVFVVLASLQQYLPFTVLKLWRWSNSTTMSIVATVLTVYGIETCGLVAI